MELNKKHGFPVHLAVIISIVAASFFLASCEERRYLSRRDAITLGAGDATATNQATHTINPWPRDAKNTTIESDGKRVLVGVKRYQKNQSLEPEGLESTTISVEEGSGASTNAGIQR
ncbi:hypothetical protein MnTg02_01024 [bacterium MnTg02]|nr:hypothetical protein MnTg02_01024 [bacterium MnTg02]